jgi:uncharacterized protein (DUF1330 family)
MNLDDLTKPVDAKTVADLINAQFGTNYKIDKLRLKESVGLLNKTDQMIVEFKQKENLYDSENNAAYMKLLMVNEAAAKQVTELTNHINIQESEMKNKLLPKALKIAALGGTLTEKQLDALRINESMKAVLRNKGAAQQVMRKLIENKNAAKKAITEGEIDQAQTTIAAQDIADQIQSMIEKFADIKYKNLPALHDSIRDAQGVDAAQTFNTSVSSSLDELTTSLEAAKGDVNNAVATLTGQEVAADGDLDLDSMDGEEADLDIDLDLDAELDLGGGDEGEDFDMDLEADDEEIDLGRERR